MELKLEAACRGKSKAKGGLNIDSLQELVRIHGLHPYPEVLSRTKLLELLCPKKGRAGAGAGATVVKRERLKIRRTKPVSVYHRFDRVKILGDEVCKYVKDTKLEREMEAAKILARIDPHMRHTVYAQRKCVIDGNEGIVMPFGGRTFVVLYDKVEMGEHIEYPLDKIREEMNNLRRFIVRMNSEGLYHNDIHFNNILYTDKDGDIILRLIDFEASASVCTSRHSDVEVIDRMTLHFS